MPVQHGSDAVLKRMRRGLGSEGIKKRINELRDVNSDIVLRTSIIVGFPGETEDDFQRLYDMIEEIEFDRLGSLPIRKKRGPTAQYLKMMCPLKSRQSAWIPL